MVWLRENAEAEEIRAAWLHATGEWKDPAARRRAAKIKPAYDLAGWVAYISKPSKAGEPVAPGRAWTVWCVDQFAKIEPQRIEISMGHLDRIRRSIGRLLSNPRARKVRRRHLPRCQSWARLMHGATALRIVQHAIATAPEELQSPTHPEKSTPAPTEAPDGPSHPKEHAASIVTPTVATAAEPTAPKAVPASRRAWMWGWRPTLRAPVLGGRELTAACRGPPEARRIA